MPSLNLCAIVGLVLSAMTFIAGWEANGWRLGASLSAQEATTATADAQVARQALDELVNASAIVHAAATDYAGIQDKLGAKIDVIQKALKNASPLPPDCHPTVDRVRAVSDAIDAANAAATAAR